MRNPVRQLVELGPLPSSEAADEALLRKYEDLLRDIPTPLTPQEAKALIRLFGPDDCYGLAWTMLHLIESTPGWPLPDCMNGLCGEWVQRLRRRADQARGGGAAPTG